MRTGWLAAAAALISVSAMAPLINSQEAMAMESSQQKIVKLPKPE